MGLDLKINWSELWNSLAKGIELGLKNIRASITQVIVDLVFYLRLAGIVFITLISIYCIAKILSCIFKTLRVCRSCCFQSKAKTSGSKIINLRLKSKFLRRLQKRQRFKKTSLA
nr:hypothetical protein [Walnut Creek virus]